MNNMILAIDSKVDENIAGDIQSSAQQYAHHHFQNQFSYLVQKTEQGHRNFVIFINHLDNALQKKILFSFMKAEDINNCVIIAPVVSLKDNLETGDLLLYEDMIQLDEISKDVDQSQIREKHILNKPMFCSYLRRRLIGLLNQEMEALHDEGTAISFKNFRNETSAEGLLFGNWNIDGMTLDIFSIAIFAKEHHIHCAPIGIVKRKSVNLETEPMTTASSNGKYYSHFKKTTKLLINNVSFFKDIPTLCNQLEFREYL